MKATISFVSFVFGGFLVFASAAFAHPQPNNPEATAPATVYINGGANGQSFTLNVSPDGQLASTDISPTDVLIAYVDSTVPVKCFFSRKLEREEKSVRYDVISEVITSGGVHLSGYRSANRLFCYDSSTEADRDDTFKVFVTTESGEHGLVTLTLSRPTFAMVNMNPNYKSLSEDVRGITIVHHPRRTDPDWDKHTEVRCRIASPGINLNFGLTHGLKFSPAMNIEKIACSTENFRGLITSIGKRSARPSTGPSFTF